MQIYKQDLTKKIKYINYVKGLLIFQKIVVYLCREIMNI